MHERIITGVSLARARCSGRDYVDIPNLGESSSWIRNTPLDLVEVREALVSSRFNACYDQEGRVIPGTRLIRSADRVINVAERSTETKNTTLDEAVFGGVFFTRHYGHFLTETLARLWPLLEGNFQHHTWIFRVAGRRPEHDIPQHMHDFFLALGFQGRIQFSNQPTLVKKLYVPAPSNINGAHCHAIFRGMTRKIGSVLQPDSGSTKYSGRQVYLSRSRLSNQHRKIVNEAALERELAARDFLVVSPQELAISDQIALFSDASRVVGPIGSAFHTALLSKSDSGTVVYLTDFSPPGTFHVLDKACDLNASYVPCLYPGIPRFKRNSNYVVDISQALRFLQAGL